MTVRELLAELQGILFRIAVWSILGFAGIGSYVTVQEDSGILVGGAALMLITIECLLAALALREYHNEE